MVNYKHKVVTNIKYVVIDKNGDSMLEGIHDTVEDAKNALEEYIQDNYNNVEDFIICEVKPLFKCETEKKVNLISVDSW